MSNSDYVPGSDAEFDIWQESLVDNAEQNKTLWGISEDGLAKVKALQTNWVSAFSKASNKQNRTAADVTAKDSARYDYEKAIRPFVAQWLSKNEKVTDSDRTRMGLTVKTGTRTLTPVPTTSPVGTIDFSVRQQHTIRVVGVLKNQ